MAGHDALRGMTQEQTSVELDGKFLLLKDGAPSDGASGDVGFAKGAIAINQAGTGANDRIFVNVGTAASPTWKYMTAGG